MIAALTQIDEYLEKRAELISRIIRYEETLSFSSFSQFMKSPAHFLRYKLDKKEETSAMIFGTLVHCLILEPDDFDQRYVIQKTGEPSTDMGKAFCTAVIEGNDIHTSFEMAGYKRGTPEKTYESYAQYIEFKKGLKDRRPVSQNDMDLAQRIKDKVYQNDASRYVLDAVSETERRIEWKRGGYNWRGFIDGKGEGIKFDLKLTADAHPSKFGYKVRDMHYNHQAVMYNDAFDPQDRYYIVAIDRGLNVSVHHITPGAMDVAREEIAYYIKKFKKCVFLGEWEKSYDFYGPYAGIFEI